jgi:repressor LexA
MKKQRTLGQVARTIMDFYRDRRRMPTYSEMAALLDSRSKGVPQFWVKRLLAAGILEKDERGFLKPGSSAFSLPLLGTVEAGVPASAEESRRDPVSLAEYLAFRPEESFLLQVSGDSMTGAGIMAGDLVVVDKGRQATPGNIVLAEVDGNWTLKFLRRDEAGTYLEAANSFYPAIRSRGELRIGGVVTGLIRKYFP